MKRKILLVSIIASSVVSCTTAYKTGQTPDDVYFSPTPVYNDYVRRDTKEDNTVYTNGDVYNTEDRTIRRRINNRRYRSYDDRYNYPYGYNNGYGKYPVYTDAKTNTNTAPRKYNLDVYKNNPAPANTNTTPSGKLGTQQNTESNTTPVRKFDNKTNTGSGVGNFIRKVLSGTGSESSNNNSYQNSSSSNSSSTNNNSKSSNNNNTNSSNSNKSSSGNVPVRKF